MYKELKPEKYWQKNTKANPKQDKVDIYNRIMSGNYVGSLKKDGEYTRFIIEDGAATMTGRGVSTTTNEFVDNTAKVPTFVNFLKEMFEDGTCLLGELYMPGKTSKDVRTIMGCLPAKSIERQKKTPLTFYIFDIWGINGRSLLNSTIEERITSLEILRPLLEKHPFIKVAEYVTEPQSISNLISYAFENGEEGLVLTMKGSTPNPGARTAWKTIKIKKEFEQSLDAFLTGNIRITDRDYTGKELSTWTYWENIKTEEKLIGPYYAQYTAGMSIEPISKPYYYGWPKSFEIAVLDGEKEVSLGFVSSGLTDQIKAEYTANPTSFRHRPVSIQGMEMTNDGAIRHPKFLGFRDDTISWKDCTKDKL